MAIAQRRMTLEEFLKLPEIDEKPYLELCDGVVTEKVSPKLLHSAMQGAVLDIVNRFARPRKLARALPELRASYDGASTVPDVSVYVWDRLPLDPSGRFVNDVFEPPDIAFEIVSPEQTVAQLVIRCLWYVAHGVRIAILLNPESPLTVAFRPGVEPVVLLDEGTLDLGDVIPGFALDVREMFAALFAD
jgi:Uma2 family endonuclease